MFNILSSLLTFFYFMGEHEVMAHFYLLISACCNRFFCCVPISHTALCVSLCVGGRAYFGLFTAATAFALSKPIGTIQFKSICRIVNLIACVLFLLWLTREPKDEKANFSCCNLATTIL